MRYLMVIPFFFLLIACGGNQNSSAESETTAPSKYSAGEKVYMNKCVACHQKNGEGVEGAFPPLANSDYLLADKNRAISIVANGMSGEITVNGKKYNSVMTNQGLNQDEVRNVVNYILNAWGNNGGEVSREEVSEALK